MNKYVTNLTLPNGTNVSIKDSECRTNLSNEIRRATAKETELEDANTNLRDDLTTKIAKINSNIKGIENKNTEQDNELSTLSTMLSSPYNFKGDVASISALPASGAVNDTYYVQGVKYKVTWTGSAWVQSSLSEADYQTELSEIKEDISQIYDGYLNVGNTTYKNGTFLRPQDGDTRTGYDDFKTSDYIDVSMFKSFKVQSGYICLYTKDKVFTRAINTDGTQTGPYNFGEQEVYIRIGSDVNSTNIIYVSKETVFAKMPIIDFHNAIVENECIPKSAIKDLPTTALPSNITTVSKNGGKYTSIQEATSRSNGTDTILVTRGVYDETNWQISNDEYGQKRSTKNIAGIERFTTIARRYGSDYADDVLHVGFECYVKSMSLKALKSEGATTCGYALHADNNWLANGKPNVFEDCYFYSDGRQAVGIGSRPNCDLVFRNCIFETDADNAGAVFFHNSADKAHQGNNQRITFENCTFHSHKGRALHIEVIGGDNNRIKLTLNRCLLYSDNLNGDDLIVVEKSAYTGTENTNIDLVNCFGNNIDISQYIV